MESWSLLELNKSIARQLKSAMPDLYWVVAEINELQVNSAGHCFMELVEKAPQDGQITAKARANIWAYHFRMLSPYFETVTGQRLTAGMKVMLQASVEYHELYGLSLQITDINPTFTAGDIAMQRQAVIHRLTDEGIFDMNRELEMPDIPLRIAVISSETAAGYGDFADQLHHNRHGYAFRHTLFAALMQGNEAEASIIHALEQIFEREEEFDAVALMRGGGSQSDLNCFNSYRLASYIAQFPLPVITGIGHDRDSTVADLVACVSLKTPTAVAEYLIHRAMTVDMQLNELAGRLVRAVERTVSRHTDRLQNLSHRLTVITGAHIHVKGKELHTLQLKLSSAAIRRIELQQSLISALHAQITRLSAASLSHQHDMITHLEDRIRLLDPVNLLRRGYSITICDGKTVRSIQTLEKGKRIETVLCDGNIESIVI